jgi:hypothetical protein
MAVGQQPPAEEPPMEAKKEITWTLGGQVWEFKEVLTSYEPIKGTFNEITREAVWTLQLVRDLQPGESILHNDTKDTPFRPVLLSAERTVIARDAKVQITPISGKMGDTLQMAVSLPAGEILAGVKYIRIERRTNVGF